jgi:hypothetical protein
MSTEHGLNPNSLPVTIWGTDARGIRFNEEVKTVRIALRAVELDSAHAIAIGDVIGLRYLDREARFRATESVILRQDTYRVTLESLDDVCLWEAELTLATQAPDAKDNRRASFSSQVRAASCGRSSSPRSAPTAVTSRAAPRFPLAPMYRCALR